MAPPKQTCQQRVGLQWRRTGHDCCPALQVAGDFNRLFGGGRNKNARAEIESSLQSRQVVARLRGHVAVHARLIRLLRHSTRILILLLC